MENTSAVLTKYTIMLSDLKRFAIQLEGIDYSERLQEDVKNSSRDSLRRQRKSMTSTLRGPRIQFSAEKLLKLLGALLKEHVKIVAVC